MGQVLASSDNVVLPPGFGFQPKDEVLVNHYLKLKNTGNDSDVDKVIVTIKNINTCDPSELPRLCSKPWDDNIYWYFFCKWNPCGKGNGFIRKIKTGSGTDLGSWKKTGKDLYIMDLETNIIVSGKRSILSFNRSCTDSDDAETRYIIHVFEMINHSSNQSEPYVLCRLHENPTKTKKNKFDTPSNVESEMRGDITPFNFEIPIPPAVIPRVQDNSIGEQHNGSFSQSPDSIVLDGDELSFDNIYNGNTHLPTAETQAFQEYGEEPEDHCEMQDSIGFPELEVSLENMMDYEGVDGQGNFQVFRLENGHQRSFFQSPDSSLLHGGNVPEAPSATQALDGQTKLDLQLQPVFSPDYNDSPLQLANMQFDFPDENFWRNLDSYSYANHQIASPHSLVHQHLGLLPNSS